MKSAKVHSTGRRCPICSSEKVRSILTIGNVPVPANRFFKSKQEALACERADISLVACRSCSFFWNESFDRRRVVYGKEYRTELDHSSTWSAMNDEAIDILADHLNPVGKTILEIGCGSGEFLRKLCLRTRSRGVGYDPVLDPHGLCLNKAPDRLLYHDRLFEPRTDPVEADLVVMRHVLEHLDDPLDFLRQIKWRSAGSKSYLYLEVPNFGHTLDTASIFEIIYEHCHYHTPSSLRLLLKRSGYRIVLERLLFGGRYLSMLGEKVPVIQKVNAARVRSNEKSLSRLAQSGTRWFKTVAELKGKNETVALWGAGSKGVMFANFVAEIGLIKAMIDIDPYKKGLFAAGSGIPIVGPDGLDELQPSTIIVANSAYIEEIESCLHCRPIPVLIPLDKPI